MHSYFSWDFLRIFDNSTPYPSNKETISGYCAYPCNLWSTAESIISANGGQIDLKFTSDNLSQFKGFWLEYRLGKNPFMISCTSLLIFKTKILYLNSHIMTNSFLYFHNSSCNRTTWWRCM